MTEFQLDTSGAIHFSVRYAKVKGLLVFYRWADLSPFVSGYVEALFAADDHDLQTGRVEDGIRHRFSDLAPETLARIIEDCERFVHLHPAWDHRDGGNLFWRERQIGFEGFAQEFMGETLPKAFPPLTVSLNDDGKVVFQ